MSFSLSPHSIDEIRTTSRQIVRELGFMGGSFAGTDLSPSAVHALIEIDRDARVTARDLADRLHLEKSSVSRMLRKLVLSGDVVEDAGEDDSRFKRLFLTASGKQRVSGIHAFARAQVSDALKRLKPEQARTVSEGLRLYADALVSGQHEPTVRSAVEILPGYRTGLIAGITEMHAHFYERQAGLGQRFESVVAGGLAAFCDRLANPKNMIWVAMHGEDIVGSIAIDGEDLGANVAHLRWFIVADDMRGRGVGRRLLSSALSFVDMQGFQETHLWTFSGLSAARHLYENHGFVCVEERFGAQWGNEKMEQRFVRSRR